MSDTDQTTDLLERLRAMSEVNALGERSMAALAADEIERLRAMLAEAHDVLTAGVAETVQRHALLTQKVGEALR
jgi:uncharacterized small protein (DUF1192 family)